eukprot:1573904-Amphidinium_carterae.1
MARLARVLHQCWPIKTHSGRRTNLKHGPLTPKYQVNHTTHVSLKHIEAEQLTYIRQSHKD